VADIVPAGRLNEGIGIFGVSGLTGLAFGPFVCEWLIQTSGFHAFFLAAAAMAGVGFLSHFFSRESSVDFSRDLRRSFFSVFRGRKMAMVAVLALLFGFGSAASGNFVSPLAQERHLTFISLYYIAYSAAAVLTRLFGARLADRLGEERILPYALTLTGVGLLTLILSGGNGVLALSGLLSGCGHGFLYPCLNVLAVRGEPVEIRGKITGIFTGSIDAGALIGSIILGQIGQWAGFPALFLAAGLALLLGLGIFKLGR
jgi:predicted MFS family arabinose efflux permease